MLYNVTHISLPHSLLFPDTDARQLTQIHTVEMALETHTHTQPLSFPTFNNAL